jgi:hypothetical protein
MAKKVELAFDQEIKTNKIVGTIQILIGVVVFLMSLGFLVGRGLKSEVALTFFTALFMVITGLHTRRR